MLENLLRCIALPECSNYNVIGADEFHQIDLNTFPILIIANIGSRLNSPGFHWYSLIVTLKGKRFEVEYFDPLGLSLRQHQVKIPFAPNKENKIRIQSKTSNKCGEFNLMFMYYKLNGYSTDQFISLFSRTNLEENDVIATKFCRKLKRSWYHLRLTKLPLIHCVPFVDNPHCIK